MQSRIVIYKQVCNFQHNVNRVIVLDNVLQVPCDMVVNATLAAMVKHSRQPGLAVYQVASSHKNPLFLKHFFRIVHDYFVEHPLLNVEEAPLKGELRLFSFFPNLMLFKLFLLLTFTLPLQVSKHICVYVASWLAQLLALMHACTCAHILFQRIFVQNPTEPFENCIHT